MEQRKANYVYIFFRVGGSMVTYGGMSKQPVTVPVVRFLYGGVWGSHLG